MQLLVFRTHFAGFFVSTNPTVGLSLNASLQSRGSLTGGNLSSALTRVRTPSLINTVGCGSARTRPLSPAGAYLPGINIKSQKIVSPKAGWQKGKEGKEAPSPEGSNKNRKNTDRHQGATEHGAPLVQRLHISVNTQLMHHAERRVVSGAGHRRPLRLVQQPPA